MRKLVPSERLTSKEDTISQLLNQNLGDFLGKRKQYCDLLMGVTGSLPRKSRHQTLPDA